jgi:hypothetical protein
MEYIFGTSGLNDDEVLKTKGEEFTDLEGWQEVVQDFPDAKRTDRFRIAAKVGQDTDAEGAKYTWYTIDHHNTIIDKTPMLDAKLDYLYMMTGVDMPEEGGSDDGTQSEV